MNLHIPDQKLLNEVDRLDARLAKYANKTTT